MVVNVPKIGRPANPYMPTKEHGIYRFVNWINGKSYVGSALNLYRRRIDHIKDLRANKHRSSYFQNSWNKHGEYNFQFEVLEIIKDKSNLLEREQHWINKFKSFDEKFGYNLNPIAGSNLGRKFNDEFREKARNRQLGKKATEETKQRMSEARIGLERDPTIGLKISQTKKGKGIGRKIPPQQLANMRIAQQARRLKEFEAGLVTCLGAKR